MSKAINATCPSCQNVDIIPSAFIDKHSGKSIVVKCKSCRHAYRQQLPDSTNRHTRVDLDKLNAYKSEQIASLSIEFKDKINILPLSLGQNTIGRDSLSDIDVVSDPTLSRVHFYLTVQKTSEQQYEYIVQDAESANKLLLNDNPSHLNAETSFFLKLTDTLKAGETYFQLQPEFHNLD